MENSSPAVGKPASGVRIRGYEQSCHPHCNRLTMIPRCSKTMKVQRPSTILEISCRCFKKNAHFDDNE
ncbi:hypothetical protein KIN20_030985 [Parelaphostrongylus tenuis]|uniref:Uncharacterized protein n=1 Tax=Parelaphostrongylus tenuis TaxID=148309 RepID=A0AAD5R4H2_PARTN|nr:hypothetical protein KIN20_030985 [Parelaphostrongylus tenuis]